MGTFSMLPFLQFVIAIIIIIFAAKAAGYLSYKLGQPTVMGEVLAGLLLGPSLLNFLNWPVFTDTHLNVTISHLAEVGVLLLVFLAGLELYLPELIKAGKGAVVTGSLGFALTLGLGFVLALFFAFETKQALFLGLMLAPTSIGISAQTLIELKVLRGKVGTTLLGAAAIDDILGVLGVSIFLSFFVGGAIGEITGVLMILLMMTIYLIIASACGYWVLPKLAEIIERMPISQGLIAFTFIIVLFYSWSAGVFGHMAAIIGAFLAGLFLARSSQKDKIEGGIAAIAYGIFVPIFFVNVGLSSNIRLISSSGLWLLAGMLVVVIISKLIGAGIGGRIGGMTNRESLQLGFGMIPRGEVVLIIATVGVLDGVIDADIYATVVVLVILTILLIPPILRYLFSQSHESTR
ncbi:MAG: cation:proton antiporter [Chloroflexi bacterium]|nr:cation:proton antiporter [Chloroflexota bacterium]